MQPPLKIDERRLTTSDGATLVVQALGPDDAPTLLLLGGATWSLDWWEDDLCAALVEGGVRVLRYDQRDTGGSTSWPVGEPTYGADDLAADVLAVLDEFDVGSAHVLGLSMGGGLAQRVAAEHPPRVRSLTLVSTSPAADTGRELSPPTPEVLASFEVEAPAPDWDDPEAVVDWAVAGERPYAGPEAFDEPALRAVLHRVVARTADMAAATTNHFVALEKDADPVRLADVAAPVLVVHGSADPLFPFDHAQVLAEVLGAGDVLVLDGVGHQAPPRATWPAFVGAVLAHVEAAEAAAG